VPGQENDVFGLTLEEIKQKYPERYKVYLELLRAVKNEKEIVSARKEEMQTWIQALNNLEEYIRDHQSKVEKGEKEEILKTRQFQSFLKLRDFIERGRKRGKIVLPTGVGKTVLFSEFVKAFNLPTLIVVPTKTLVKQTTDELKVFAPRLKVGNVYTHAKEFDSNVVVTTYDSLVAHIESGKFDVNKYKNVVLDEAHESLTKIRQKAIQKLQDVGTIITEFTATDVRNDKVKLNSEEIDRLETVEAIETGLLCGVTCVVAKVKVDMSKFLVKTVDGLDIAEFEKELGRKSVYKSCIDMHRQAFENEKAIVSCSSVYGEMGAIKVAQQYSKEKKSNGEYFRVAVLHGDMSEDDRNEIINDCKVGKYDILCGYKLAETGLNLPNFSLLYNVTPRFTPIPATQRGGRVLRVDPKNPNKHATVVDFLYEQEDDKKVEKKKPILYAEVLGKSFVMPKGSDLKEKESKDGDDKKVKDKEGKDDVVGPSGDNVDGNDKPKIPDIELEGVEVIVDSEEVMRVVSNLNEGVLFESRKSGTFEILMSHVRKAGIVSSSQYKEKAAENGWWSMTTLMKEKQWRKWEAEGKNPWDEFLGRKTEGKKTFEEITRVVRANLRDLGSSDRYGDNASKYGLPSSNTLLKYPEWVKLVSEKKNPWDVILGRETQEIKVDWSFNSLRADVRSKGINSAFQYQKQVKVNRWWSYARLVRSPEWKKWIEQGVNPVEEFFRGKITDKEKREKAKEKVKKGGK
jgi:superfamily II DNA or RNA helicase